MPDTDPITPDPELAEPATPDPEPAAPTDDAALLEEIAAMASELGIAPGQLKGRLEASRKWEQRAKKADEEAEKARLASLDDQQRAVEEARQAGRSEAEAELLKFKVAAAHQLPVELAERLVGATEDELAEDAARLKAFMAPPTPSAPPAPTGSADGGPQGTPPSQPTTQERIAAAEAAGDLRGAMRLKGLLLAEAAGATGA